jgi:hypothetical protein
MGAVAMGWFVAAAFFLKFWKTQGDRLFGMFAIAFFLLGATRIGLVMTGRSVEGYTSWYWLRLAAFLLILVAVVDKNRHRAST